MPCVRPIAPGLHAASVPRPPAEPADSGTQACGCAPCQHRPGNKRWTPGPIVQTESRPLKSFQPVHASVAEYGEWRRQSWTQAHIYRQWLGFLRVVHTSSFAASSILPQCVTVYTTEMAVASPIGCPLLPYENTHTVMLPSGMFFIWNVVWNVVGQPKQICK